MRLSSEKVFDDIYEHDKWGFGSGHGSLPAATKSYRFFLQNFLTNNDIKSVVDFGCGDWQFSKYINWDNVDYLGLETVSSLVEGNQEKYSKANIRFAKSPNDFSKIPKADLLIVKDVLQHLESEQIKDFANKVLRNFHYALITNNVIPDTHLNIEIKTGLFRPLDLRKPPFSLKATAVHSFGRERPTISLRHFNVFNPWKEIVLLFESK